MSPPAIFLIRFNISIIVRIEFSPLVWIGVIKGHYWPEETTDEGPTRIYAGARTFLKTYKSPKKLHNIINCLESNSKFSILLDLIKLKQTDFHT